MNFHQPYIYAETAFHHEGNFDYLLRLIEATAETGAKGVKFQVLLNLNDFLSTQHSGYAQISKWIFTQEQWETACKAAKAKNLDVIWMPLDVASVELAQKFQDQILYLDLHSVSFYDEKLNKAIKTAGIPLIIVSGGRTISEINEKVDFYGDQFKVLMTGFQAFPTNLKEVKLSRIKSYSSIFPNSTIGYTDHSDFNDELAIVSNEYAYLLGASIFEKHLTLEEGTKRTDFEAAVGIQKVKEIVQRLQRLYELVTIAQSENELWTMTSSETTYRNRQKVWVASRDLEPGLALTSNDLALKMINQQGGVANQSELIGKKVNKNIQRDSLISLNDIYPD